MWFFWQGCADAELSLQAIEKEGAARAEVMANAGLYNYAPAL